MVIVFHLKNKWFKNQILAFENMDSYRPQLLWNKKTFSWLLRIVWRHKDTKSNRWVDLKRNVRMSRPSAVHLLNKTVQCHKSLKRFRNFYIMFLRWMFFVVFFFATATLFLLLLPRVSSVLSSSPSPSPSCLVDVWFWLLWCRQHWQVKQQGSWAAPNAKLLACLKQKGKKRRQKEKNPTVLWRIFGSSSNFLQGRWLQEENSLQGTKDLPSRNCHFHF